MRLRSLDFRFTRIVVGTHNLAAGGAVTAYTFGKVFIHPSYNNRILSNDIALIKVATPIKFNDLVKPIEYNPHAVGGRETLLLSKSCTKLVNLRNWSLTLSSAGWGSLNENGENSAVLQKINLKSLTNHECKVQHNMRDVDFGHICTFNKEEEGACKVDNKVLQTNKLFKIDFILTDTGWQGQPIDFEWDTGRNL